METYREEWDQSYARKENHIFYPKEEYVRFLNRFVRKKTGIDSFDDILDFSEPVRALDFGCGIGRIAALFEEFGCEAYGVDLSAEAIESARKLASHLGFPELAKRLAVSDGPSLPFDDGFFRVVVSEAVLDSMTFDLARTIMRDLARVSSRYVFVSLISGDDGTHHREFAGEERVETQHEQGTVQSYFNYSKIQALIEGTGLSIKWGRLLHETSITDGFRYGRYYVLLEHEGGAD